MRKTIVLAFSGRGRPFLERLRAQEEKDEVLQALDEYRKPRDALLILVSDYVKICAPRLEELGEALPVRHTLPELLDSISVNVRISSYFYCVCVCVLQGVLLQGEFPPPPASNVLCLFESVSYRISNEIVIHLCLFKHSPYQL